MDIQKEREAFEKHASKFFTDSKEAFKTNGDQYLYDEVIWMWDCWIERAKAQAVPEWIDYTKQSPRIDGRYQIFISGEQITADWQSPFGFLDPVEGEALIQDLISHWGMLPEPPKPQEPTND